MIWFNIKCPIELHCIKEVGPRLAAEIKKRAELDEASECGEAEPALNKEGETDRPLPPPPVEEGGGPEMEAAPVMEAPPAAHASGQASSTAKDVADAAMEPKAGPVDSSDLAKQLRVAELQLEVKRLLPGCSLCSLTGMLLAVAGVIFS